VCGPPGERLEDQEVEGALEEVGGGLAHALPSDAEVSAKMRWVTSNVKVWARRGRRFAPRFSTPKRRTAPRHPVLYVGALRAPRRFSTSRHFVPLVGADAAGAAWLPFATGERSEPRTDERRAAARRREPTSGPKAREVENRRAGRSPAK
jgi:hypothetical protein